MNRAELQEALTLEMIDSMDLKTMEQLVYDYLMEGYDKYSDEELTTEVEELRGQLVLINLRTFLYTNQDPDSYNDRWLTRSLAQSRQLVSLLYPTVYAVRTTFGCVRLE